MQQINQYWEKAQQQSQQFNTAVRIRHFYYARRRVLTTKVVFFDDEMSELPELLVSNLRWCDLPVELIRLSQSGENIACILQFDSNDFRAKIQEHSFLADCFSHRTGNLRMLAAAYLQLYTEMLEFSDSNSKARLTSRLSELKRQLAHFPNQITEFPHIIEKLQTDIASSLNATELRHSLQSRHHARVEIINHVLKLRKEGIHSVREICEICGISKSSYYIYCHREDRNMWGDIKPVGRPLDENSLRPVEKVLIKKMVDDPNQCLTASEIATTLSSQLHRPITKNRVYRYLSKELCYSYKRNSYAAPVAFDKEQIAIRHLICQKLIEFLYQGKNVLFLDESGFDVGISREYSYSRRGVKPYRKKQNRTARLNLIMAILKDKIFAFQVRKGAHNEHSFVSFIIELTRKISQLGPQFASNVVLYLDNHRTHTSALSLQLLNSVGITTLFAPVAYYQINPIELIFGICKSRIKRQVITDVYF